VPRGGFLGLAGSLLQVDRRDGPPAFATVSAAVLGAGRGLLLSVVILDVPGGGLRFVRETGPGLLGWRWRSLPPAASGARRSSGQESAVCDGQVAGRAAPAGQVAEEPGAVIGLDPASAGV
jgi:hypothetical protein